MAWYHRILNITRSNQLSRDIEREVAFHLAERTDELVARGVPREQAIRQAQRQFGNTTSQRERTRSADLAEWVQSVAGDLRYAVRGLWRTPVFTVAAVASLGLGVGANSAIFTLIDSLLIRPLPVERPNELFLVTGDSMDANGYFTNPLWEQIRDRQTAFVSVGAFTGANLNLSDGGEARRVNGAMVGGDYFPTFAVRPAVGRLFTSADDRRGCSGVAVLGYRFWQREYAGSRDAVGKILRLSGHPVEIVGVASEDFRGVDVGREPEIYLPLCSSDLINDTPGALDRRTRWFLRAIGRVRPDLTPAQAGARMKSMAKAVYAETLPSEYSVENQKDYLTRGLYLKPASRGVSDMRTTLGKPLYALMVAVGLVLLIACANVANLLLSRAEARQHELAIRQAIGAARMRLVRQLLTESAILALLGAVAGVVLAQWGAPSLVRLIQPNAGQDAMSLDLSLNMRLLGFALAVTTATVVLFGVAPAWRATRISAQASMKAQGRGVLTGHSRWSFGKSLVMLQVALSLVLMVGAALFVGTFKRLSNVNPGFKPEGILLADVSLRRTGLTGEAVREMRRQILDRSRAVPGIVAASSMDVTPVSGSSWNDMVRVDGFTPKKDDDAVTFFNEVGDAYFNTMGTRFLGGRDFNDADRTGAPNVSIVNDAWARRFFGNASPVGRSYRLQLRDTLSAPYTIVGVVENSKYRTLREAPEAVAYLPATQAREAAFHTTLVLRARGEPMSAVAAVRRAMEEVNPAIVLDFNTMTRILSESLQSERLLAVLTSAFGALAALLAMVGLYGVMAYAVARRRAELGVRIALGAGRERVVRLVLGDVATVVGIGVLAGGTVALATTRFVASLLYGMPPTDVTAFLVSIALLSLAALCAGLVPAWRAASVDPMIALRE
ncbi:MAG: ABC transporter permease [Gemmatimonadaceae bacterium]